MDRKHLSCRQSNSKSENWFKKYREVGEKILGHWTGVKYSKLENHLNIL